jgi:glycerol-3-phosphate acyltransferase PlsX
MEFKDANGVILVEDNPIEITRSKADSSMGVAFDCVLRGEADAFVSAGSTAAIAIGGRLTVGMLKNVRRSALAPIIPTAKTPFILLDAGSNTNCRAQMLEQFAVMGSVYMHKIHNIKSPRVGLLNIGSEEEKGRDLEREAYALLKKNTTINFIGNAEAREIPLGYCDVVVTDGYTGNIFLKTIEGMGKYIKVSMKELFMRNTFTKIGGLLSKSGIKAFADKMDYRRVGGSPLIGTIKPVIKAHGSCEAYAFKNAIKQAVDYVEKEVIAEMAKNLDVLNG